MTRKIAATYIVLICLSSLALAQKSSNAKISTIREQIESLELICKKDNLTPGIKTACLTDLNRLYTELATEIRAWIKELRQGEPLFTGTDKVSYDRLLAMADASLKEAENRARDNAEKLRHSSAPQDAGTRNGADGMAGSSKSILSGVVTNDVGEGLRNSLVKLRSWRGQEYSSSTDHNGKYVTTELEPGNYTLTVSPENPELKTYSSLLVLDAGQMRSPNIVLHPAPATIPIKVIDSKKKAIPNVKVTLKILSKNDGEIKPISVYTDKDGVHTFSNLEPGIYQINAELEGYTADNWGRTLTPGKNKEEVYTLKRPDAAISLEVYENRPDGNDEKKASIPNVKIRLWKIESQKETETEIVQSYQNSMYTVRGITQGDYRIALECDGFETYTIDKVTLDVDEVVERRVMLKRISEGPYYRGVIGFQQLGSSSLAPKQRLFFDLLLSSGLGKSVHPRLRLWGQIQTGSIQDPGIATVKTAVDNVQTDILQKRLNGLFDSIEFLTGPQIFLKESKFGSVKVRANAIAAFGAITPRIPENEVTSNIFKYTQDAKAQLGLSDNVCPATGSQENCKSYISFVPKDRNRFFRQYYAGVRLETIYGVTSPTSPPAILDIMFGQNEALTGGTSKGVVMRIDGFFPLSFTRENGSGASTSFLYLFGTANLRVARPTTSDPLILERVTGTTITQGEPKLLIRPISPDDRDGYRIGIGINILDLLSKATSKQ